MIFRDAFVSPAVTANLLTYGKFQIPKHIDYIDNAITNAIAKGNGKVMINLPPRHGKSELISFALPLWHLINFPEKKIILASYEQTFATQWSRRIRDTIKQHDDSLPVKVNRESSSVQYFELQGARGSLSAVGAGGPITGRGADLLIIDDPIKNAEEANSEAQREKLYEWYISVAQTRLEPGATVILLMTRWHVDDLCGKLKNLQEDWEVISLPAIAEADDLLGRLPGTALWAERYDIERLKYIQKMSGDYFFSALMQQSPFLQEGNFFKISDFKMMDIAFFKQSFREHEYNVYCTVDLAISQSTKADYTVFCIFAVCYHRVYVFNIHRDRLSFPDQLKTAETLKELWDIDLFVVEEVQYQAAFSQALRDKQVPVKSVRPSKDKFIRSLPMQSFVNSGKVTLIKGDYVSPFLSEITAFPNSKHDDMVDAFCYISEILKLNSGILPAGDRIPSSPLTEGF